MLARLRQDFRWQLLLVALVGLAIRVTAVLTWSRNFDPQGDQNFYWRQGQDLASGYGFVYRNNFGERVATAVHPPLYSAYLGVVSFLGGTSHAWHRMASTLLGFAAVIVIGFAARRVAGNRAGLLAAGFAALYPNLWVNDAMMLSESMYALTIGLVFLAAYRFKDDRSTWSAVLLGGAVALAALTRAEATFLFVLLIIPLALIGTSQTWRDRFVRAGVALVAGGLVLAPWVIRNYVTFENHPLTVSNGSGFVVEISNCDQTYGIPPAEPKLNDDGTVEDPNKLLGYWAGECDRTPWPSGDETVVAAAKQQTGVDYIKDHKKRFPVVVAARIGRIWDVWRPGQSYDFNKFFERRGDLTTLSGMAMYYPMLLASLAGLWVLFKRKVTMIPFLAVFAMTTMTAAVSFGITRYRVGADVGITILAAVAIDALLRRWWPVASKTQDGAGDAPTATGSTPEEIDLTRLADPVGAP